MTDFELTLDERQDRIIEILAEGVLALIERWRSFYSEYVFLTIKDVKDGVLLRADEVKISRIGVVSKGV